MLVALQTVLFLALIIKILKVLREAKEEHAKESVEKKTQEVLEKVNFNDEFDRYQGLAHLEALEILSRECEAKVRP